MTGPKADEIRLRRYTDELRDEILAFSDYWGSHSILEPQVYPEKMTRGEWDEQFQAWSEQKRKLAEKSVGQGHG